MVIQVKKRLATSGLALIFIGVIAHAQTQGGQPSSGGQSAGGAGSPRHTIDRVLLVYRMAGTDLTSELKVRFTDALPGQSLNLQKDNITVRTTTTGRDIPVNDDAKFEEGSFKAVIIKFKPPTPLKPGLDPMSGDAGVEVCFKNVTFSDSTRASNVCASGQILTSENANEVYAAVVQAAKNKTQTPKTTDEKNIFASGFAVKSSGVASQGGAQLSLNSNDLEIPGLSASMHLNKATAGNADPKHFDSELTYRRTFAADAARLRRMLKPLSVFNDPLATIAEKMQAGSQLDTLLKESRAGFWGGLIGALLLDFGGKLEAEAMNFHVTNFVADGAIQLQSPTLTLFGSHRGYWKFRIIAGGTELGKNVSNSNPPQAAATGSQPLSLSDVNYIIRFKTGGVLSLLYRNPNGQFPLGRIEGDLGIVDRYLFRPEVMFDQNTMKDISTTKGNKPYYYADVKFYFTDTPKGRFGFKVSFNRGSLPPVFAHTNSFQIGLLFESADDGKQVSGPPQNK